MEHALAHGDVHGDDPSPRAPFHALTAGLAAAGIATALCAVLAAVRPLPAWGDATVALERETGVLYVRVNNTVHPALNLPSAQLISGTHGAPRSIAGSVISEAERGPLLGIPGAPPVIGEILAAGQSRWTVCDRETTTVIAGALDPGARPVGPSQAVLVTGPSGTTYLLQDGHRARVDTTDGAVVTAIGAEGVVPLAVSKTLLDVLPEITPVVMPQIPHAGNPGPTGLPGFTVGDVVGVQGAAGTDFYVVLDGGVQRIGEVAAEALRSTGRSASVTVVAPAAIADVPQLGSLPVHGFPERRPEIIGAGHHICSSWNDGDVEVLAAEKLPVASGGPVTLAQADGAGPHTDAVSLPAGRAAFVTDGNGGLTGWVITDLGVRFAVADADAARALALPAPLHAPRAVLEALPTGPVLSRAAALTAHDVPATPPPS